MQHLGEIYKARAATAAALTLLASACVASEPREETAAASAVLAEQGTLEEQQAYRYLKTYGYVPESKADSRAFGERLSEALLLFQEINNLPADGALNEATRERMAQPRCSHPDTNLVQKKLGGPSASYVLNSKWPTNYITYSHANYTPDLPASTVEHALQDAGYRWSLANPALTFQRLSPPAGYISVEFHTGDHGDDFPFNSGIAAHAFPPGTSGIAGDIHFNDGLQWTNGSPGGQNIYVTALHEMGHALGLGHTAVAGSVMSAGFVNTLYFSNDDVEAIRRNYQPQPPNQLTTVNEQCYGWNAVTWAASPGATEYKVYRSSSPTFTSSVYVGYSTEPSYELQVSVGATWYVRVEACNQYACGPMSYAQTSASYYNGCD